LGKGGTNSIGRPNPIPADPMRQGDNPGSGKGGANRGHMRGGGFPGPGALNPATGDGRSQDSDGSTQSLDVQRTRISGKHDPRATHR
jgi:hypothetical protein